MTCCANAAVLVVLACAGVSDAFLDNSQHCLLSPWSAWSAPFGFGTIKRERSILRYGSYGGIQCPNPNDLTQMKRTSQRPTINATVNSVISNLLKPQGTQVGGQAVGQVRDLLIIIDSSGSIGSDSFDIAKTQLANLLGLLCPIPDPFKSIQKAALIKYSDQVVEMFNFNDERDTLQVQQAIKSMTYTPGGTCTTCAFKYAIDMFQVRKGSRTDPKVKKEVLILTDGQSNSGVDATAAAIDLQNVAAVYGLMIGQETNQGMTELESYVSKPLDEHLFAISNYQELNQLLILIKEQLSAKQEPCAPFDI